MPKCSDQSTVLICNGSHTRGIPDGRVLHQGQAVIGLVLDDTGERNGVIG